MKHNKRILDAHIAFLISNPISLKLAEGDDLEGKYLTVNTFDEAISKYSHYFPIFIFFDLGKAICFEFIFPFAIRKSAL